MTKVIDRTIGPSRKVTINDVARLSGVSKKTVSRVLNKSPSVGAETREKVERVIRETSYTPDPQARALAFRKSFLIGMIYDNPSPQYIVNIQRGILDSLEETRFQLVLRPYDRGDPAAQEKINRFVTEQRPFGVILPPPISQDDALCAMLSRHDCAYVRISSVEFDAPHQSIRTFDMEGAAQAGRHLAKLGHTRIAHIHGMRLFNSVRERLNGFVRGLEEYGVTLQQNHILEGAYDYESGFSCTEKLLAADERPTAIFFGNDDMAIGGYQAIRQAGLRIPNDISVVGFDDTPMAARLWPAMTSVRAPIREMGAAAASVLLEVARDKYRKDRVTFTPGLVLRASTAPPK